MQNNKIEMSFQTKLETLCRLYVGMSLYVSMLIIARFQFYWHFEINFRNYKKKICNFRYKL